MYCRLQIDIGWPELVSAAFGPAVSAKALSKRASVLQDIWPGKFIVIGLSVRTLFDALLSLLELNPGECIIASGINIQNMADIASMHGLRIVAVDIDPATLVPPPGALLQAQEETGAKLCLVAQLFGATHKIHDAAALRQRGVLVVEDAAQAFSGARYDGDPDADLTLFSFGPIKRCTALGGALAISRSKDVAERLQKVLAAYGVLSDAWFRRRALKYIVLKAISAPLPFAALIFTLSALGKDVDQWVGGAARGFNGARLMDSIRKNPPVRLQALLFERLIQSHSIPSRRDGCEEILRSIPATATRIGELSERHEYWLLPLRSTSSSDILTIFRASGFDVTRGATSLRTLNPSTTPLAGALLDEIIYLPNPATLPPQARRRMVRLLGALYQRGLMR